ncbi:TIGR02466 family protein [Marinomonas ostreistagni]|uniref:2OG-Fe(II) oxygenase family protein n=1 Tax=Marinomonas ostreistagni TaxID=359209 RepID=A0ABS0ZEU8_9GAMM|nr:TIGR02466 family protein [Marinomonas ostreistagni]MBJ7552176.1 2OG-Fe(II) oxygenase family protein [Marinomonas ostreistagni]
METPTIEAIDAWTTPLFVAELADHEFLKDALLTHIYQRQQEQENAVDSDVAVQAKHNLSESRLDFLEDEVPEVMELRRMVEELIAEVAFEVNHQYWPEDAEAYAHVIESWYHITKNGGYHDAHSHPNCSWCGIYYLDPGEANLEGRNGINRFYDPRVNAEHYADPGTAYLGGQGFWDFAPKEGQVVIFPSYLKHSALPYFGQKDRVVVAFNCVIELD